MYYYIDGEGLYKGRFVMCPCIEIGFVSEYIGRPYIRK